AGRILRGMRRRPVILLAVILIFLGLHRPAAAQLPAAVVRPQRIVLLIDSSTVSQRMITQFRNGLLSFLDGRPGKPEMAFLTTGGQMRIRVRPTDQRDQIRKAVEGFTSDGGINAFVESMLEADQRFLKTATDRRPVFVIVATESNKDNEADVDLYNKFMSDFR